MVTICIHYTKFHVDNLNKLLLKYENEVLVTVFNHCIHFLLFYISFSYTDKVFSQVDSSYIPYCRVDNDVWSHKLQVIPPFFLPFHTPNHTYTHTQVEFASSVHCQVYASVHKMTKYMVTKSAVPVPRPGCPAPHRYIYSLPFARPA